MAEPVTCRDNEKMSLLMSLAIDGLMDAGDQKLLHGHLAVCPICRAEWAAMQQVTDLFRDAPLVGPRLGFATRVERRLADTSRKRRRIFGGVAVLTSSLSLAAVTVATVVVIILGVVAWNWLGSLPDIQQGTSAVSQIASGMGLIGKGLSLYLTDFLLLFGLPVVLLVGICVAVLLAIWIWVFVRRPGYDGSGYT
jgi:predicted anti-sigma-YlaC factor YlaD